MKDIVNSEVEAACATQLLVVPSCQRTPAPTMKKTARTRTPMATRSSPFLQRSKIPGFLAKMADIYRSNAFGTAHRAHNFMLGKRAELLR